MKEFEDSTPSAKEIFNRATQLNDEKERFAYLDSACQGNTELRHTIDSMIEVHLANLTNPLDEIDFLFAVNEESRDSQALAFENGPPEQRIVGNYKLLEQIGRGGFGTVYMAQQTTPVKRLVAIKLINPGMDSQEVLARFDAERQALAILDHPNIAKVLEAGTDQNGRPYFVMELVRGIPITEYCDDGRLSTEERLRLFSEVCRAVQHAHQKGIIHRDLKPSNVLVTMHDDQPVPKVIDFGIAKALNQQLTEQTLVTGFQHFLGTPLYMSPEQAQMNGIDIDTRSDIYSLGVLLYELLTGTTPFSKESLTQAGFDELRRIIREDDPPRPSTRLTTIDAKLLSTIADRRRVDQRQICDLLHGELDWIVMKALEKNRNRRYETVSGFVADIKRFLNGEAVLACPPTMRYWLSRYARRHRTLIATVLLVTCCLIGGLVGTTSSAIKAFKESDRAAKAEREADAEARRVAAAEQEARYQRQQSEANLEAALVAMERLLKHVSNPELADIPELQPTFEKILEDSLAYYDQFVAVHGTSPATQYQASLVLHQLGRFASDMFRAPKAHEAYSRAIVLADQLVASKPDERIYREQQAQAYLVSGRLLADTVSLPDSDSLGGQRLKRAGVLYHELLALDPENEDYQRGEAAALYSQANLLRRTDPDHPDRLILAERAYGLTNRSIRSMPACKILADALVKTDPERADRLYREALEIRRSEANPTRVMTNTLAWLCDTVAVHFQDRHPEEAERLWNESIDVSWRLCREYPEIHRNYVTLADSLKHYSQFLIANQRTSEAVQRFDEISRELASSSRFQSVKAELLTILKTPEEAIEELTAAMQEHSEILWYPILRAEIYHQIGNCEAALMDLNGVQRVLTDELIEEDSELAIRTYRARYEMNFEQQRYLDAIDDATNLLTKVPSCYWMHKRRAAALFELGKYQESLADLNRGVNLKHTDISNLTWIPLEKTLKCSDEVFRRGFLQLVTRTVELNSHSKDSLAAQVAILLAFAESSNDQQNSTP
ncbi:serine/threonine-protein kinase [Thalassoglobus sp. JC818]|uniref:serine/threonine-protein kinase n=1 Tax=Thalassoglobus sp. JC818 TaxID=3232136 RepID=UPI003459358D